jgi:hypothetical protein
MEQRVSQSRAVDLAMKDGALRSHLEASKLLSMEANV